MKISKRGYYGTRHTWYKGRQTVQDHESAPFSVRILITPQDNSTLKLRSRLFAYLPVYDNQCFGSGSMWILIEMASLDPDPNPYSGSRTVKMTSKKEEK